jgi:hypothetical protein
MNPPAQATTNNCAAHGGRGFFPVTSFLFFRRLLDLAHPRIFDNRNFEQILPFLPQAFSGIIDRARHLHNFPIKI